MIRTSKSTSILSMTLGSMRWNRLSKIV